MTVLDTFRFEAHSPAMNKSAVIIATIVASFTFTGVAHANGDREPECGYDQVCHESTDPTTTIVATDEPPVPTTTTTTVAPPVTIGAINGPATVNVPAPEPQVTVAPFVCVGTMVADVCVPTTTTVVTHAAAPLPVTGRASERLAGLGLILMALGGLVLGVRWVFKRT